MRNRWHLLIPLFALLFQIVPPLFLRVVAAMAYGQRPWLPESWERPVSLVGIALCAVICLLLGNLGVYTLLTRSRLRIAVPLIVLCCVPVLIGGAVYLHAIFVFLALA